MDDQRNPQSEREQDAETAGTTSVETTATHPTTMFDQNDDRESLDEITRFARKRAAIWGLAAGGLMSLILVVCAGLIYLLGTS